MLLVLDNGSVFTPKLVGLLRSMRVDFRRVAAAEFDVRPEDFDSYILSGRTRNSAETNVLNSRIIRHAISEKRPLLGICYGAEMLALTTGGTIRRMPRVRRGKETIEILDSNPLYMGSMSVFESHGFEIAKLGGPLVRLGRSPACENELVRLGDSHIFGAQFHPEMTPDGHALIARFVSL